MNTSCSLSGKLLVAQRRISQGWQEGNSGFGNVNSHAQILPSPSTREGLGGMENGWGAEPCALIFSYFNFLIIFFSPLDCLWDLRFGYAIGEFPRQKRDEGLWVDMVGSVDEKGQDRPTPNM